jgi:predicted  nucleic acid-binding Zn-ribbon protein
VGVLALFVTAVTGIGLGSTAVYKTGKYEERIITLEDNIKRITENEKLLKEALEFMQSDIEKIERKKGSILENTSSELENLNGFYQILLVRPHI